ncbi:hypothetical protein HAZT_HAZT011885 [Hyalella azteca]|uniref:UBR-type domain-containing protein n=1 Tax=Hyalella azteca TaxID=294128 RepID=A0A6A0H3N1_HYAAZ|nr:hypothetical protein HAZT_HAZT011885 [Hyalella azteca]
MKRQAVYACLTCSPVGGAGGRAGMCLACSLHCHDTHNIVELYTKRDFRYPEQPDEDEMIQCCVCEDWYHTRVSVQSFSAMCVRTGTTLR